MERGIFVNVAGATLAGIAGWLMVSSPARADVLDADPSNYKMLLQQLEPGDTLSLAPGTYTRLTIQSLHGTPDAEIVITGPEEGEPAVVVGESGYNTVQLYDAAYVTIRNLVVDVQGLGVDAINAKDSVSHDITIENNLLQGFPADSQQIVGINTKSTAYNWVIRGNTILEPGTGLYLGNSNGEAPFVAGIVERNLVVSSTGYCMQIKHQNDYTPVEGMPSGPNVTIIRHNVFIKDDRPSPDGNRPNLLVSGFPDTGPGAEDHYEIYGNFLFYNPRESLFQGAGRMSIHDNVFAAAGDDQTAINVTPHQGKGVQIAHVYNNTILGGARGIRLGEAASESDAVVGNLIFADTPISGPFTDDRDNLVDTVQNAGDYVNDHTLELGALDPYPLPGAVEGDPIDLSKFADDTDYDRDYNEVSKGDFTFRGAYAGAGDNPGCLLDAEPKTDCSPPGGGDGGTTGGPGGTDGGSADGTGGADSSSGGSAATSGGTDGISDSTGPGETDTGSDGCGCTTSPVGTPPIGSLALAILTVMGTTRPRRRT